MQSLLLLCPGGAPMAIKVGTSMQSNDCPGVGIFVLLYSCPHGGIQLSYIPSVILKANSLFAFASLPSLPRVPQGTLDYVRSHSSMQEFLDGGLLDVSGWARTQLDGHVLLAKLPVLCPHGKAPASSCVSVIFEGDIHLHSEPEELKF